LPQEVLRVHSELSWQMTPWND